MVHQLVVVDGSESSRLIFEEIMLDVELAIIEWSLSLWGEKGEERWAGTRADDVCRGLFIFISWSSSSSLRVDQNPTWRPKVKGKPEQRNLQGRGGGACLAGEWGDGEVACSLPA